MKTHRFTHWFILVGCLLLLTGRSIARAQINFDTASTETVSGSSFTYQGQVLQNDEPVNGACDFQFSLWDAVSAGNQIASLQTLPNVPVVNGLFVVSLDFGAVFNGEPRWLEMAVGCPAGGAFKPVTPRQELTATPYAFRASNAPWSGLTGVPADFADGIDNDTLYTAGSGLSLINTEFAVTGAPWSGLTGVPAGFADGIDNDTTYIAGYGLTLSGTVFTVTGAPWSGLTGVPAGFADGIDNNTTYTAGVGLVLSGTEFSVTGVPWSRLTGVPAGFSDGIDNDTLYSAGLGLVLAGTQFSLSFAGSGNANTVARSDHNHNGIYALFSHTHAGEAITSGTVADARIASSLTRDTEVMGIVLAGDGSGSGLDADLLDGQQSSFYQNASNLNAGTLGPAFYSAYNDLSSEGDLDLSADGDLLTRAQGDSRFVNEGQPDSVNSTMIANGTVTASDLQDGASLAEISNNDGAGSGLDADLLDGQHGSAYTYSAGDGLALAGNQFSMHGTSYQQVVVVAKSGGDFTTIQGALDSITDASNTKRYLVWVAPGVYTERVTMKPYVDIEGANTSLTRISYGASATLNTGTVVAASNAELRSITVENSGGNINGVGIYNASTSYFYLFKVYVTVSGAAYHYGVYNIGANNCVITYSAISATGEQGDLSYGIYNSNSSVTVQYSQVSALGGGGNYGIYNVGSSGSYTVIVRDSQVTASIGTLRNDTAYTLRVAVSQLAGGAVSGSGITCAGVYDENYSFYPATCP